MNGSNTGNLSRIFLRYGNLITGWTGRDYRTIKKEQLKTCGRPFNGPLQVQVDGTVNMCCFDYNGKLLLEDLNAQSLAEIFNSVAYKKIRDAIFLETLRK